MKRKQRRWQPRPPRPIGKGFRCSQMKLSLCMIVKNEAENLVPCITPLLKVVDEIVVVDTGSTDGTKGIARELGAKVFDFPWCDDFSAARNESIRHSTGDYILWLDADDRIDASGVEKMVLLKKAFPQRKDRAYYLTIKSQSQIDGGTHFLQLRIFPKLDEVGFEGRVHEQITKALTKKGIELNETDIVVHHTGYDDPNTILLKSERNLRILEEEFRADPSHPLLHYHKARTLYAINRLDEAILHMEKVIGNLFVKERERHFYLDASLLLGQFYTEMEKYEEALFLYRQLAKEFMDNGLIHFHLGEVLYLMEDYSGALAELTKSLQYPQKVGLIPLNVDWIQRFRYFLLWQSYSKVGGDALAREMFMKSLEDSYGHHKDLERLGLLCLKKGGFNEATQYFTKAIQIGGESDKVYINLGLAYRKLGQWGDAEKVLTKAFEINPQRIEALTNLGYLYYEMGERSKALPFFMQALSIDPYLPDVRLTLSEIYFLQYDLDSLVEQCDELLKALDLPRNICLESFKDLSDLYEKIGESFSERERRALSLMAYHLSFLIHPSRAILDRILSMAKGSGVFEPTIRKIEKALAFHKQQGQQTASFEEIFGQA